MSTSNESTDKVYPLDIMEFVTRFPELRDGLEKLNRNGYGYFTGVSITIGYTHQRCTYTLNKNDYEEIPSWDEIDAWYLKEHGRHFLATPR